MNEIYFTDFSYKCLYQNYKMTLQEFIKNKIINKASYDYFMSKYVYLHDYQKKAIKEAVGVLYE